MRKSVILILVIGLSLILIIGYITSVFISVNAISYEIGEIKITPGIEQTQLIPYPIYEGYLGVSTPLSLVNKGFYSLEDISINITIKATNWTISSHLDGQQIGQGINIIGNIHPQETWSGSLGVNITDYIPHLAVENCIILIFIDIHLIYKPIFTIPIDYRPDVIELEYDAPFIP